MKKSIYSLVLMDSVVEAADRLAAALGTSRSNLINQILAERLSCPTPEMRMRDIFSQLEELMDAADVFQLQPQPSDSMLSVRSSLQYRYKPTIRYSVELLREPSEYFGVLKVSFRTQSAQLVAELERFFLFWSELEKRYLAGRFPKPIRYTLEDGRLTRTLMLPQDSALCTNKTLGNAIYDYIRVFDRILKHAFSLPENPALARRRAEAEYQKELAAGNLSI